MDSKSAEEPLFNRGSSTDDNFYDTIPSSPVYDNGASHLMPQDPEERARLEEEMKQELAKLEEEISTLRSVLSAKVRASNDIKQKLGITPMQEFKSDMSQGIKNIKESEVVVKTNEKFHQMSESVAQSEAWGKTASAFKAVGAFTTKKVGDLRNSNAFKSFEGKVGGAYNTVKDKVVGPKPDDDRGEPITVSNMSTDEITVTDQPADKLPEEKVPL